MSTRSLIVRLYSVDFIIRWPMARVNQHGQQFQFEPQQSKWHSTPIDCCNCSPFHSNVKCEWVAISCSIYRHLHKVKDKSNQVTPFIDSANVEVTINLSSHLIVYMQYAKMDDVCMHVCMRLTRLGRLYPDLKSISFVNCFRSHSFPTSSDYWRRFESSFQLYLMELELHVLR